MSLIIHYFKPSLIHAMLHLVRIPFRYTQLFLTLLDVNKICKSTPSKYPILKLRFPHILQKAWCTGTLNVHWRTLNGHVNSILSALFMSREKSPKHMLVLKFEHIMVVISSKIKIQSKEIFINICPLYFSKNNRAIYCKNNLSVK